MICALRNDFQFCALRNNPQSAQRPFPIHWSVEDIGAAPLVQDNNGQKLAHIYYGEEPGRRSAGELLSNDEARRIAAKFAELAELLRKP